MDLVVSARFKEELGIDILFALFCECPTASNLETFSGKPEASATEIISIPSSSDTTPSARPSAMGMSTPASDNVSLASNVDFQRALRIISEESGVATEELTDDTVFGNVGVDSLLSLITVSRVRDELELDVHHEFLLFLGCPTVGDLKQFLSGESNAKDRAQPLAESKLVPTPAPETAEDLAKKDSTPLHSDSEYLALTARKKAVDESIGKYTAGFFLMGWIVYTVLLWTGRTT